jgi:hypothetical protein
MWDSENDHEETEDSWFEDNDENPEDPEEYKRRVFEMEIPPVRWAEDIERIRSPEIREREIEAAKDFLENEKELDRKLEAGEISESQHLFDREIQVIHGGATISTRCALAAEGITYEILGDLGDDVTYKLRPKLDLPKLRPEIRETVEALGPDAAQELADRMLEEDNQGFKEAHEIISRQVKLARNRKK